MRIGIVCPYDLSLPGGVQDLTRQLAGRLARLGEEAVLVGPGAEDQAGAIGIGRTIRLPANRSLVPITLDPRAFRATRRRLADVDVVHVHEPFIPVVGWAGLWGRKPVVATFHADPAPWTRRLYALAARPARSWLGNAHLTAVSAVASEALPASWGTVEIVPNAVDVAAYALPVPRRPDRVVFVGRDDPRKGLDTILAAWPRVREAHPRAELVVVGAAREPAAGVRFLGWLEEEEKRRELAAASVFVAPNLGGESFGLVVAEAMAAGCAVVASDIPGFRPVVGDAGRLVPSRDPASWAGAVASLLSDPVAARDLGEMGRARVARFDWSHVTDAYLRTYESAVKRHRSRIGRHKEL